MEIRRRGKTDLWWALGIITFCAIVAAVSMPNFLRARAQGRSTACKSCLKNIGTALAMYAEDHGKAFPDSLSRLVPNYLKTLPSCPTVGRETYSASYTVAHGGKGDEAYTVFCSGDNHAGIYAPNYPQYTSRAGLLERRR